MPRDTLQAFMNSMDDGISPVSEEMEDDELNEKFQIIFSFLMQYMLEKIQKAQSNLDRDNQTPGNSDNSISQKSSQDQYGSTAVKRDCPYPVKEVVKRFND